MHMHTQQAIKNVVTVISPNTRGNNRVAPVVAGISTLAGTESRCRFYYSRMKGHIAVAKAGALNSAASTHAMELPGE